MAPIVSLVTSCVLFFGAWWFWPHSAAIDGVRSQAFGNFYAGPTGSGSTLLTGYARATDDLIVTLSGRSLHALELEVSVPEGAVHPKESSDLRGWQSSMTFRVQAPGSVALLVRWDAPDAPRSQGHPLSLLLRDHRHRLCSGKSLQVSVRE